jgi:hypothetical protein
MEQSPSSENNRRSSGQEFTRVCETISSPSPEPHRFSLDSRALSLGPNLILPSYLPIGNVALYIHSLIRIHGVVLH